MTTQQLHLFNGLYLVILAAVAVLTRATSRRIGGALAGAAAAGVVALGIITFGERAGWWHFAILWVQRRKEAKLLAMVVLNRWLRHLAWRGYRLRSQRSIQKRRDRACSRHSLTHRTEKALGFSPPF